MSMKCQRDVSEMSIRSHWDVSEMSRVSQQEETRKQRDVKATRPTCRKALLIDTLMS